MTGSDNFGPIRIPAGHVFLMAEGTTTKALRDKQEWLGPLCLEAGFRMSDRLHIHLYGDSRAT